MQRLETLRRPMASVKRTLIKQLHLNTNLKQDMEYTLHKTRLEDEPAVNQFFLQNNHPPQPLIVVSGVEKALPRFPLPLIQSSNDFNVKALDAEGQIIGVSAVRAQDSTILQFNNSNDALKIGKAEFLSFAEKNSGVGTLPKDTLEINTVAIREDWRQRNLARQLSKESMRLAKDMGCTSMKTICISEFAAKIARSLGWREYYRLAYKDYSRQSGADVILRPIPPHEFFYYFVIEL